MECKDHRKVECEDIADDDFYAEIRRQILLLTTEDDEEHVMPSQMKRMSSCGSKDSFMKTVHSGKRHNLAWWETNETACSAPVWLTNLWRSHASVRSSGGTGVFIPHIVKSRRNKHKAGRRGALVIGV